MLRIVPHTVPRVGRSYEHFPDGFELHLLPLTRTPPRAAGWRDGVTRTPKPTVRGDCLTCADLVTVHALQDGETAMWSAAQKGHEEVFRALLVAGADKLAKDNVSERRVGGSIGDRLYFGETWQPSVEPRRPVRN